MSLRCEGTDLRHDLGVMGDRPRDQLRKKCDEEGVIERRKVTHQTAIGIDQKRDLLEGDERNTDRQDDVRHHPLGTKKIVHVGDEEAGIFEIAEEAEIEDDADRENSAGAGARKPAIDDQLAEAEINRHREQEKEEILRSPPRIKDERRSHQPSDWPEYGLRPAQQGMPREHDRKETEDENIGIKQHRSVQPVSPSSGRPQPTSPQCPRRLYRF